MKRKSSYESRMEEKGGWKHGWHWNVMHNTSENWRGEDVQEREDDTGPEDGEREEVDGRKLLKRIAHCEEDGDLRRRGWTCAVRHDKEERQRNSAVGVQQWQKVHRRKV